MVESNADIAEDENTRVYALNRALHRVIIAEDVEKPDDIPMYDDDEKMEEAKKEQKAVESQRKLFEGLKFFINREVLYVSNYKCMSVGQSETTQKLSHYF